MSPRLLSVLLVVVLALAARAQRICSLDLGPDRTICAGQNATLNAPAGYADYRWSTGASSPSITVNTAGMYSCVVRTGFDLVVNGNLNGGAVGFQSPFIWNHDISSSGTYYIGDNAVEHAPNLTGTGNGPFLMVNAGDANEGWNLWCQTVEACAGQTYALSYRACDLAGIAPPRLGWYLNNQAQGAAERVPAGPGIWQSFTTSWTAPNDGPVSFCLRIMGTSDAGSTIGVDDLSIVSTTTLTDTVNVTVTPLPEVDLGGTRVGCSNAPLLLDASLPGASHLWSTGARTPTISVTTPGTYAVLTTLQNCSSYDEVEVSFRTVPTDLLDARLASCANVPVDITSHFPADSYTWNTAATTASIRPDTSGTYLLTATFGPCTVQDSIVFTSLALPTPDLPALVLLCPGDSLHLDASVAGARYRWSHGDTTATVLVRTPGNYTVITTANGCSDTTTVQVSAAVAPAVQLPASLFFCAGDSVAVNVGAPGASVIWSDGVSGVERWFSSPGSYSLQATLGVCGLSAHTVVSEQALPVLDLGPDLLLCPDSSAILAPATQGGSLLWRDGSYPPTRTVRNSGTYQATLTVNGCSNSDSVTVTVLPAPVLTLGGPFTICPGDTLQVAVGNNWSSIRWSDGSNARTRSFHTASEMAVIVTDPYGCPATDSLVVRMPYVALALGNDTAMCPGTRFLLDASYPGAVDYQWWGAHPHTGGSSMEVDGPGLYGVDVSIGTCILRDSIRVTNSPVPEPRLGNDTILCPASTIVLRTGSDGAHRWQDGSSTTNYTVTAPGNYHVTITNTEGCSASDTVHVLAFVPTAWQLGNDTLLCEGGTLELLNPLPNLPARWSTGATTDIITVSSTGIYVLALEEEGCTVRDTIAVSFLARPPLTLDGDRALCAGSALLLSAHTLSEATVVWDDGSTARTRSVTTAGTYWARASIEHCSSSDTAHVAQFAVPVPHLGVDTAICTNTPITLSSGIPNATHLWSDGSRGNSVLAGPGTWWVEATVNGCVGRAERRIGALAVPSLVLPNDTILCSGATLTVNAISNGSVVWTDGTPGTDRTLVDPGHYVAIAQLGPCSTRDSLLLTIVPPVVVDLGNDTNLCNTDPLVLTVGENGTVAWSDGSNGASLTVQIPGSYHVTVNDRGCTASDTINVGHVELPVPYLGPDTVLCSGSSVLLHVEPGNAAIRWNTGSTQPYLLVDRPGSYTVTLSVSGCSVTATRRFSGVQQVHASPLPAVVTICPLDKAELDAGIPGAELLWSTGDTTAIITVPAGTYRLRASGQCISVDQTVEVVVADCGPVVHIPNAFSPNGDGVNELFLPVVRGELHTYTFRVYDRWGSVVFSSTDALQGWDGNLNGKPLPAGVYTWQVHYAGVDQRGYRADVLTGHVTMIR